jgi:hypothetical protein
VGEVGGSNPLSPTNSAPSSGIFFALKNDAILKCYYRVMVGTLRVNPSLIS